MNLAFFEPDIAANFGAGLRLAACLGLNVDVIEPCGFPLDDRRLKRAAMDYGQLPSIVRHSTFARFYDAKEETNARIVLLTRHAGDFHDTFDFQADDILMVGRESSGVPQNVYDSLSVKVRIAMAPDARSLNVITALAIVAGEAMRQRGGFDNLRTKRHE